jgi:thiol-disulfide isomerase/thioredoxin
MIEDLTSATKNPVSKFINAINKTDTTGVPLFIKFYWKDCGHCVSLAPIWNKVAKQHSGDKIFFLGVEADVVNRLKKDERVLASSYNDVIQPITGYPTLFMVKNKSFIPYDQDEREEANLNSFIQKYIVKKDRVATLKNRKPTSGGGTCKIKKFKTRSKSKSKNLKKIKRRATQRR